MITPEKIRTLPLSAASGLVIIGDYFYVIADDEVHLSVFSLRDENFHQRIPLFSDKLPTEKKARKKHKPDLEALTQLPASAEHPHGALLALGSGSKVKGSENKRQRAVIIPFNADGRASTQTITLDLSVLYASLPLDDTNIEGAFIKDDQLVLMQRGNNRHEQSALVFSGVGPLLRQQKGSDPSIKIIHYTMPTIEDVPLGFTDGIMMPNGNILFTAVAENTDDSYNDGACVGAAIGEINARGEMIRCDVLAQPYKVEGIAAVADQLYLVTDADNAGIPAMLYRCALAGSF